MLLWIQDKVIMRIFITLVMCYLLALPAALAGESLVEEHENRLQRELDRAEREKTSFSLYRQFFSDTEMDSLLILKKKFFEEKFREAVSKHFSAEDESVELDTITSLEIPCYDLASEWAREEIRGFGQFGVKEDSVFALSEARKMAAYSIASENINRVGEFFVDGIRTYISTKSLKGMMVKRFRLWEHILDHSEVICSGKVWDDVCVAIKMDSNTLSEYALSLRIKKPERDFQKLYDENKYFQIFVKDELKWMFLDDILLY